MITAFAAQKPRRNCYAKGMKLRPELMTATSDFAGGEIA
jgi:hypothetical protein